MVALCTKCFDQWGGGGVHCAPGVLTNWGGGGALYTRCFDHWGVHCAPGVLTNGGGGCTVHQVF